MSPVVASAIAPVRLPTAQEVIEAASLTGTLDPVGEGSPDGTVRVPSTQKGGP
jgi:hypothetical protein